MIKAAAGVDCRDRGVHSFQRDQNCWVLGENEKLQKQNLKHGPRFIIPGVSSADLNDVFNAFLRIILEARRVSSDLAYWREDRSHLWGEILDLHEEGCVSPHVGELLLFTKEVKVKEIGMCHFN